MTITRHVPRRPPTARPHPGRARPAAVPGAASTGPRRSRSPSSPATSGCGTSSSAGQFSVDLLEDLAGTADKIRGLSKSRAGQDFLINLLHHKRAMLYFTQPSTRTFLSFMAACQILGITCNEVRDPSTSSRDQGRNAVRLDPHVLQLLRPDRHAQPDRPAGRGVRVPDERPVGPRPAQRADRQRRLGRRPASHAGAARHLHAAAHVPVRQPQGLAGRRTASTRSAGSIRRSTAAWPNKIYGFCGDIGRGRTVRSLAELLAGYEGVTLVFVSPQHPTLALRDDLRAAAARPAACGSSKSIRSRSRSTAGRSSSRSTPST